MLKPEFFYQITLSIFVLQSFDTKKNTIKISLTKTVFSFASYVDALQNTCVLSKQKVSNVYDRKPDSAPLGILLYFCNLSSVMVLT